jgi:hypothetical protein
LLATGNDERLWLEGWNRHVLLVSPNTLLFVLRTVEYLWRQERVGRNAVEIANRTLSGICRAVGVNAPRRSEELLDKPFMMKVSVKPGDAQYGPSNEIKEYAECEGKASTTTAQASTSPPWRR